MLKHNILGKYVLNLFRFPKGSFLAIGVGKYNGIYNTWDYTIVIIPCLKKRLGGVI